MSSSILPFSTYRQLILSCSSLASQTLRLPLSFSHCFPSLPVFSSPPPLPISSFLSLLPYLVPSETEPAWHIVFTQPVTLRLYLLPTRRWGRRDRVNQPFGGFSSQLSLLPSVAESSNSVLENWLFQAFLHPLLSSFSIYSALSADSCLLHQSSHNL